MNEHERRGKPETLDVEQIMQEIRAEIVQNEAAARGQPPIVSAQGESLPADFYEHLFLAGLRHDKLVIDAQVTSMPIPFVGRWLERLRTNLHALVLSYVNYFADHQRQVNAAMVRVLDAMGAQLEAESNAPPPGASRG